MQMLLQSNNDIRIQGQSNRIWIEKNRQKSVT